MTRREILAAGVAAMAWRWELPAVAPVRFGVIADVHFGLAADALRRMRLFADEMAKRRPDFVLQLGDFCHALPVGEADEFLATWEQIPCPKRHVLGNHDMDRNTKEEAMRLWGMPARYHSFTQGNWRFLVLDLNHYRKDGELVSYAGGNYFTSGATHNWADPEQLAWLAAELPRDTRPTIVLSHQPLGLPGADGTLPPEQREVLDVLVEHNGRARMGKVIACLFGHNHVDRMEMHEGIVCVCINSASYFWHRGMHAYQEPLWATITLDEGGMRIVGRRTRFALRKPETDVIGCDSVISDRLVKLPTRAGSGG